jgi:hypothetical protein
MQISATSTSTSSALAPLPPASRPSRAPHRDAPSPRAIGTIRAIIASVEVMSRARCDRINAEGNPDRVSDWHTHHEALHATWHQLHDMLNDLHASPRGRSA